MENNRTEILREIESELASLKRQVLALEEKVEALRQAPVPEETPVEESDFTDMEIGVSDLPEAAAPVVEEIPAEVRIDTPVPEPAEEPVPVPEPVEEPVVETVIDDLPEPEPAPAPAEPEPAPAEPAQEPVAPVAPKPVAPRPETERLPWRLDKPGMAVKNIRSGISLYDRALFIGTLFKEDYALYDKTIGELNALANLDEAVDYLLERFPDWNLKSDIVYNFMMAIRKKLG
ncbi:MAG: hypothetical protein IKP01_09595 [Bacteroidales bacterium]|nr:hypothetical protein [Bacteroidales bacterium]MBR3097671.1 hypothetical protein [Bacteroidales bacterium]MBR4688557.1 hypothetical protein [Bacteroidales bacterium]